MDAGGGWYFWRSVLVCVCRLLGKVTGARRYDYQHCILKGETAVAGISSVYTAVKVMLPHSSSLEAGPASCKDDNSLS